MGENTYSKELIVTTPVDVKSVRVDWILHSHSGIEFLVKMSSLDSSIFKIPSVMVLVEYLYQNARNLMVYRRLPIFVLLLVIFYFDAHFREL